MGLQEAERSMPSMKKNFTRTCVDYSNEHYVPKKPCWILSLHSKSTASVKSTVLRVCDTKMQVKFEFFVLLIHFHTSNLAAILLQAKAGVTFLALNGCTGCNKFVYLPSDKRKSCPYIKANGEVCAEPRFGTDGQPKEVVC